MIATLTIHHMTVRDGDAKAMVLQHRGL